MVSLASLNLKSKFHWVIRLKGGRKKHLAASDDDGRARLSTICGKDYGLDDRVEARKGIESIPDLIVHGSLCSACSSQLVDTMGKLRKAFMDAGQTTEEATASADAMLKLKRDI